MSIPTSTAPQQMTVEDKLRELIKIQYGRGTELCSSARVLANKLRSQPAGPEPTQPAAYDMDMHGLVDELRDLLDSQMNGLHSDLQRAHADMGGFANDKAMVTAAAGYR